MIDLKEAAERDVLKWHLDDLAAYVIVDTYDHRENCSHVPINIYNQEPMTL